MRNLERSLLTAGALAFALSIPTVALAQFDTASVVGTVRDNTGRVLPGATVTLTNLNSGITAVQVTDGNGNYEFPTVRTGRYKVTAALVGFATGLDDEVQPSVGARQRIDFKLHAAGAAQPAPAPKPWMEIYGFAMLDIGQNFTQINPNWSDTLRVTKLPSFEDEFGKDGQTFAGVRQSRLGVRTSVPTDLGELKTQFEFELFGTGVDEGQTTFRLRHAYGELGAFGAGQYWSPFMDIDVFPNSLEYWGPTGMVFFRNVHVRWMPIKGDTRLTLAVERPGASADQGVYADRVELQGVKARFPLPDFSGEYRIGRSWGYFEVAGMLRYMEWDDINDDQFDLSGDAVGWGINLSSNVKASPNDTLRLQVVFGEGIQNYMNDSPVDIGIVNQFDNARAPIRGETLPIVGIVAFLDHNWNAQWSSAIGYSFQDIDNTDGQAPNAFNTGHYALGNLLYTPVPNVMVGGELQWGRRENFSDGFQSDGFKLQFSFKYNFSHRIGG